MSCPPGACMATTQRRPCWPRARPSRGDVGPTCATTGRSQGRRHRRRCSSTRVIARGNIPSAIKPGIAVEQVRWACEAGLPRGVMLLDAGYGNYTVLRTQISALALAYVAGILSSTSVWSAATEPLPPKRYSGRGRPPTRPRRGKGHKPVWNSPSACRCLAHGDMAGRFQRAALLAFRARAGARCPPRRNR
jgi:hypothetical protein